jgi:hypothetical protein
MRVCLVGILLLALTVVMAAQDILTNDSVVKLVKSGLGDALIVNMVKTQPGTYSLTPDDVAKLKAAGVSQEILTAMAAKGAANSTRASGAIRIPLKTPIRLSLAETVSSKAANAGDTFKVVVADDVTVDGRVVIAKGAAGTGRIIAAEKKSMATHNGKLEIAVDSVQAVDGHSVALDGHLSVGGGGVGFGKMGKDVEVKEGRVINAVVASETEVKP